MSMKKILLSISLMVVVAFMGGASACPCSDLPGLTQQWDLGDKPVGSPICVEAPTPPSGDTWAYQWMVYIEGQGWKTPAQLPGIVTVVNDHKICVTPNLDQCGKVMAVRVTITTTTDRQAGYWDGCIILLCVEWKVFNPPCPDMTDFCEGHATDANLPTGESPLFTYTYAIDAEPAPGTPMTVARLNALAPGTYTIKVYTTVTGNNVICTITITVYAKPTGGLSFS